MMTGWYNCTTRFIFMALNQVKMSRPNPKCIKNVDDRIIDNHIDHLKQYHKCNAKPAPRDRRLGAQHGAPANPEGEDKAPGKLQTADKETFKGTCPELAEEIPTAAGVCG